MKNPPLHHALEAGDEVSRGARVQAMSALQSFCGGLGSDFAGIHALGKRVCGSRLGISYLHVPTSLDT
jgi:hypothetical protein